MSSKADKTNIRHTQNYHISRNEFLINLSRIFYYVYLFDWNKNMQQSTGPTERFLTIYVSLLIRRQVNH